MYQRSIDTTNFESLIKTVNSLLARVDDLEERVIKLKREIEDLEV